MDTTPTPQKKCIFNGMKLMFYFLALGSFGISGLTVAMLIIAHQWYLSFANDTKAS